MFPFPETAHRPMPSFPSRWWAPEPPAPMARTPPPGPSPRRTPPSRRLRAQVRTWAAAVAVVLAAALVAGCTGKDTVDVGADRADQGYVSGDGTGKVVPPAEREPAPDVAGESLDGEALALRDYRGKVVVLNFWASWCAPCRDEAPALAGVYQETKDDGVEFLGVNMKDDRSAARAFDRSQEIPYPSLYDQPGEVALAFRDTVPPQAIPSTIVVDRHGRVAARVIGKTTYSQLLPMVQRIAGGGA